MPGIQTASAPPGALEPGRRAQMPLVGARFDDLGHLPDGEPELVVRVVEVRAEPDARVRAEVAEDLPLAELLVHGLELGRLHEHGAATARRVARAPDLEARLVQQLDQQLRLADRVRPDALDADL